TRSFLLIHGGRVLASGDAREVRSMLSGVPVEVELAGDGLVGLAQSATAQPWLNGLSFNAERSRLTLRVTDQARFLEFLAAAACAEGVNLSAVASPDDTLEGAFGLLLRAHRGEG